MCQEHARPGEPGPQLPPRCTHSQGGDAHYKADAQLAEPDAISRSIIAERDSRSAPGDVTGVK